MRKAFVSELVALAHADPRVVLLTADLGFSVLEPFMEAFPERFFNVGVAEQNMVGLATGLAEGGFIPFIYSIAPFAVLRPYEFLRNGPLVHNLPVRIVGIGGGMEYGINGISHYALEDVALMRVQPNMTVIVPADSLQAATCLRLSVGVPGPIYFRFGKDDLSVIEGLSGAFELGKIQCLQEGPRDGPRDVAMIAMGPIAGEAIKASEILRSKGVSSSVAVLASVSPAPEEDLAKFCSQRKLVVSIEVHYAAGGLGSLVAEVMAERGIAGRLLRFCVRSMPTEYVGSQSYMEKLSGLDGEQIASSIVQALGV